jgi:hypothetical protein
MLRPRCRVAQDFSGAMRDLRQAQEEGSVAARRLARSRWAQSGRGRAASRHRAGQAAARAARAHWNGRTGREGQATTRNRPGTGEHRQAMVELATREATSRRGSGRSRRGCGGARSASRLLASRWPTRRPVRPRWGGLTAAGPTAGPQQHGPYNVRVSSIPSNSGKEARSRSSNSDCPASAAAAR